jgi:hypothetical protein
MAKNKKLDFKKDSIDVFPKKNTIGQQVHEKVLVITNQRKKHNEMPSHTY